MNIRFRASAGRVLLAVSVIALVSACAKKGDAAAEPAAAEPAVEAVAEPEAEPVIEAEVADAAPIGSA
ncbi:MAG TPA: hypothetical protein DEA40_06635, partial [Parvularcula sp.]|nr:hypothetical protein [Parvularcula sp.]